MNRRFLPLLVGALAIGLFLSRQWPRERLVHVVLGEGASRVDLVRLRYTAAGDAEPDREVTFRYAPGHAPRIVNHEPRLVTGDYDVDIEVGLTKEPKEVEVRRRVRLEDETVQIDVSDALRAPPVVMP